MTGYESALLIFAWMVAAGSPGPATLAISGTSMGHGRKAGLTIGAGIVCGSATWGIAAGAGMSALMLANLWLFEVIRYAGAAYLLYLALKSLRRAMDPVTVTGGAGPAPRRLFLKGLLLHLTNPKAILSWGSIYAIALPPGSGPAAVWELFALLLSASIAVFLGYAVLFSSAAIARGYAAARRWFDLTFAVLFGAASVKILTAKLV
jgi:threonine/homoserine/homoserine lactone efflux protein